MKHCHKYGQDTQKLTS